jgi:hypothetical protein
VCKKSIVITWAYVLSKFNAFFANVHNSLVLMFIYSRSFTVTQQADAKQHRHDGLVIHNFRVFLVVFSLTNIKPCTEEYFELKNT